MHARIAGARGTERCVPMRVDLKFTRTPAAPAASTANGPAIMPAAARILAEHGMTAAGIIGSGKDGRILKEDALRHVRGASRAPASVAAPAQPRPAAPSTPAPVATRTNTAGQRPERRVRMTPLRKTVARRLLEAQQTAALLTTFNEVDMSEVMKLRKTHQPDFVDKHGVKLGFMSFFVKAVIEALKEYPALNAEIRGDDIVYKHYYDIGVAVGGGKGLVVPILRNAESMSFAEIELQIAEFGRKAKAGQIMPDDLTGGSFSITNGGVYGSLLSTPIVNPPRVDDGRTLLREDTPFYIALGFLKVFQTGDADYWAFEQKRRERGLLRAKLGHERGGVGGEERGGGRLEGGDALREGDGLPRRDGGVELRV